MPYPIHGTEGSRPVVDAAVSETHAYTVGPTAKIGGPGERAFGSIWRAHCQSETIHIRGAREHNLTNVTLDLPRDALIVFTGISGSGKSSLAFDTIYAEGQRRYVESLSAYARQFLGQMEKPDVDIIEGLSPAISIDQKSASRNPRSTVGTITEVYDYLRLLYARIGKPHCHNCGRPIAAADRRADHRLDPGVGRRDEAAGARPDRQGAQGRVRVDARRPRAQGLLAGSHRRRDERSVREDQARALQAAHDRDRRRPDRPEGRTSARGSPTRSRPRWGSRNGVVDVEIVDRRRSRTPSATRSRRTSRA